MPGLWRDDLRCRAKLVHTGEMTGEVRQTTHSASLPDNVIDLSAGLVTGGLIALVYLGTAGIPRILLALAFVFFVPGRAIMTNWPEMIGWPGVAMPMILSVTFLTLLATVTLWAHVWQPVILFEVEAWLSLAGLCLGMARRNRRSRGSQSGRPESRPWRSTQ